MSSFNENHQRCQGACQQQGTTDTRSRASVAVVTITAVDLALIRPNFAFAVRVAVLGTESFGNAIFAEQLE